VEKDVTSYLAGAHIAFVDFAIQFHPQQAEFFMTDVGNESQFLIS
jgi:hypothetical protein